MCATITAERHRSSDKVQLTKLTTLCKYGVHVQCACSMGVTCQPKSKETKDKERWPTRITIIVVDNNNWSTMRYDASRCEYTFVLFVNVFIDRQIHEWIHICFSRSVGEIGTKYSSFPLFLFFTFCSNSSARKTNIKMTDGHTRTQLLIDFGLTHFTPTFQARELCKKSIASFARNNTGKTALSTLFPVIRFIRE